MSADSFRQSGRLKPLFAPIPARHTSSRAQSQRTTQGFDVIEFIATFRRVIAAKRPSREEPPISSYEVSPVWIIIRHFQVGRIDFSAEFELSIPGLLGVMQWSSRTDAPVWRRFSRVDRQAAEETLWTAVGTRAGGRLAREGHAAEKNRSGSNTRAC